MSKFNRAATRARADGPIATEQAPSTRTYEGAPGYVRDVKGELFLLAVSNMVGEDTFYEKAGERDERFARLVRQARGIDADWTARLIRWLRAEANMRSASIVAAVEYAIEHLLQFPDGVAPAGVPAPRAVIDSACRRADEPGEVLAYYTSRYGRAIPKPIKRGVADAAARLYNERSLLKYDAAGKGFRFGDVLELTHAKPGAGKAWQGDLFQHAIDRRHDRDEPIPESLELLRLRAGLMALEPPYRRGVLDAPDRLAAAGITWEALSGWLQGPMDAAAWSAIIPSMGYMALLRNLRNFDGAGVGDDVAAAVCARLSDPEQVARSRQFPFRFYSAYNAAPSLRWGHALERALAAAVGNIPAFGGRTLVLVDTSASMHQRGISAKSTVTPATAAALFGVSLAAKGEAVDLVGFASGVFAHPVQTGASVLREVDRFLARIGEVGHGTEMASALRATYAGQDRVVVVSDMQVFADPRGGVSAAIPDQVPMYGFNLGGHRPTAMPLGGTRQEFGGLTDATFTMIPLLEAGRSADWPF